MSGDRFARDWSADDLFRLAMGLGGTTRMARELGAPPIVAEVLLREYDPTHRGEPDLERLREGLRGLLVELGSKLDPQLVGALEELLRWTEEGMG